MHHGARLGLDGTLAARLLCPALVAVVLFVSNVHFWRAEDYFAPAAELDPLLHTWSLAVEEQFYIAFPIFLLLLWRFGRRRMVPTIGALSLASLALAEWGWRNEPAASFFLLPTRAWELGAGALCALVLREGPVRGRPLLAGLGLGLIAVAVFAFDDETPFPSLYALAPVGGTALVILFARAGSPVARLLSLRAMVGIGLVSYSAYLWHQPLFALARVRSVAHPSPELMLGLVLATFALAYLSWRFVEQPFRGRTPVLSTRPAVFAASGAAAAVFVGVGLYGQATAGRFDAWMAANPERAGVYGMAMAADAIDGVYRDDGACQFNVPRLDAAVVERLRACRGTHGPGIAVLGDSHGVDFFNGLDALHDGEFVFAMTFASCWLGSGSRNCDFEGFARLLSDHPGLFERVIFHQAGYRFLASNSITAQRELFERIPEYTEVQPGEFRILEEPRGGRASLPRPARGAEPPRLGRAAHRAPHRAQLHAQCRVRPRLRAAPGARRALHRARPQTRGRLGRRGRALRLADRRGPVRSEARVHDLRRTLLARRRPLEPRRRQAFRRPAPRAGFARPARRGGRRPPPPVAAVRATVPQSLRGFGE